MNGRRCATAGVMMIIIIAIGGLVLSASAQQSPAATQPAVTITVPNHIDSHPVMTGPLGFRVEGQGATTIAVIVAVTFLLLFAIFMWALTQPRHPHTADCP